MKKITMTLLAKENSMKNCKASENQTMYRILLIACATALVVAFMVVPPRPARAASITPPPVPDNIQVPPGNELFLVGHGVGTQNYVCRPSGKGVKFVLFTPQATLFNDADEQVTTHFFSPNPFEANTDPTVVGDRMIRVTWQHSQDTSTVWGQVKPGNSAVVTSDAIPWLLVTVVDTQVGPTGGDTLTPTTFIQRLNTTGGVAPSPDCVSKNDIGKQAFVPYTADYFFYKAAD